MALGYPASRIFRAYLILGALLGICGAIIGAIVSIPASQAYANRFGNSLGLPEILMVYTPKTFAQGCLFGLVLGLCATAAPLLEILKLDPQAAIRGGEALQFSGIHTLLDKAVSLLSGGSLSRRFAFRNIFRRPGLTAAIVLLISFAMGSSIAFSIALESWKRYGETGFAREPWEAAVAFRVPLDDKDAAPIKQTAGIAQTSPAIGGYAVLHDGDFVRDVRVMGVEPPVGMRYLIFREGGGLSGLEAEEIIVNGNFSGQHKFKLGADVDLEVDGKRTPFRVVGITSDVTVGITYVPLKTADRLFHRQGKTSAFWSKVDPAIAPEELERRLYEHEMVSYVAMKTKLRELWRELLKMITSMLDVSLFINYCLSVVFMLLGVSLTVYERVGEYGTLRSLGFRGRVITSIIFWEITAEAVLALIAAVPIALVISTYLHDRMAKAWFAIDFLHEPPIFLKVMLPGLVLLSLASIPPVLHVLRINLADAVRQKATG
jgi:ABC-type lipoprotein release transport system permease subunit